MNRFNIGDSFETTVVAVTDTTVFVDLSAKSEGVVDLAEFKDEEGYIDNKSIDLLNLSENSDIAYLVQQINEKEPLTIKYKSKIQKVIESN